jgi:hypothetical protein
MLWRRIYMNSDVDQHLKFKQVGSTLLATLYGPYVQHAYYSNPDTKTPLFPYSHTMYIA